MRAEVAARAAAAGCTPGLAVVLVGDDPASAVYVRNKDRAAREAGFAVRTERLPADTGQATLLRTIAALNADPAVDGILVQLPLPPAIPTEAVIEAIDPAKDVDGFHPLNVGRLARGEAALVPCTPRGVMRLLAASGVALRGARALVLGRSAIVGRPLAALLTAADATVTLAHSQSRDLAAECRRAEIVIAATGRPAMVRGDWIAPGAVVIDVGINRDAEGRLCGDVAYAECVGHAGAITPVPDLFSDKPSEIRAAPGAFPIAIARRLRAGGAADLARLRLRCRICLRRCFGRLFVLCHGTACGAAGPDRNRLFHPGVLSWFAALHDV